MEGKSITELRGIAQAVGVKYAWSNDKPTLIAKIKARTEPEPVKPPVISDVPNTRHPSQVAIAEALEPLKSLGLVLTFPDDRTWAVYCNRRQDSGSTSASLVTIVNCAKAVVYG